LKKSLKQGGFQFLFGRGISDTNAREFLQSFIGEIAKEIVSKIKF